MNFIERLFGVSPDAGSGLTEALLLVGAALISALAITGVRRLAAARRRSA